MKDYRIRKETNRAGGETFTPQYKGLFCWRYIWRYGYDSRDQHVLCFWTEKEAKDYITMKKREELSEYNSKVVKTEIIEY